MAWIDQQVQALAVTSITVGELWTGVLALPEGKRRQTLAQAVGRVLQGPAVLSYDAAAARVYAILRRTAQDAGRGLSVEDGMIAAICISRGAPLATRNTSDFEALPLEIVNPWQSS
jgi:predicted nucleic acid-binding protein